MQVVVRYTDAILGGFTEVPTIHGQATLQIPAGTQNGQVLTMREAGISPEAAGLAATEGVLQIGAGDSQRGAHYFTVILLLPTQASTLPIDTSAFPTDELIQAEYACAESRVHGAAIAAGRTCVRLLIWRLARHILSL